MRHVTRGHVRVFGSAGSSRARVCHPSCGFLGGGEEGFEGLRAQVTRFRVYGSGFKFRVYGLLFIGFRAQVTGFQGLVSWFRFRRGLDYTSSCISL